MVAINVVAGLGNRNLAGRSLWLDSARQLRLQLS